MPADSVNSKRPISNGPSSKRPRTFLWQISLRTFVLLVITAGAVLGIAGPPAAKFLKQWRPNRQLRPQPIPQPDEETQPSGYYESAETPLD